MEIAVRYGVRNKRTGEVWRNHIEIDDAKDFVADWLEDGGLDIFEVVKVTTTTEIAPVNY